MRAIWLAILLGTSFVSSSFAQVDVGYPDVAIGDSPYFGMDAPDENRSPFHLAIGTTYHAKPLLFEGTNGESISAIEDRLLSILSSSIRVSSSFHLLLQGRLLTYQSGDGAGPTLPLSKEVVFGRTRMGLKYGSTLSNQRTRWAV